MRSRFGDRSTSAANGNWSRPRGAYSGPGDAARSAPTRPFHRLASLLDRPPAGLPTSGDQFQSSSRDTRSSNGSNGRGGAREGGISGTTSGRPRAGEAKRQALNQWVGTSGAYDGVIDFDQATRDPGHPARFLPQYESGDHLHPSDAGYKAMAEAIDLALFNFTPVSR